MKKVFLGLVFISLFIGCYKKDNPTKEECEEIGKKYEIKNILNLRTGQYEDRTSCID